MARVLKHKPMLITLLSASICQLFAILADQYVLHLDFKVERLEHEITRTENTHEDLQNTLEVLRYAYEFSEDVSFNSFFDKRRSYNEVVSQSDLIGGEPLDFMFSEVTEIYEIHSIELSSTPAEEQNLMEIAEPLFQKIEATNARQRNNITTKIEVENERHIFILFAVIAQILSLFSLLGYFLYELKDNQ